MKTKTLPTYVIDSIDSLNKLAQQPTPNTFVTVLEHPVLRLPDDDCAAISPSFYTVFFNTVKDDCGSCCERCDFRELSVSFHVPGERIESSEYTGCVRMLAFHKELFDGICSRETFYSFLYYTSRESLYISKREKMILWSVLDYIHAESLHEIDTYSRPLLGSYISLFLQYSSRFYRRQFYLRSNLNRVILSRFDKWLDHYIQTQLPEGKSLPAPEDMARMQGLSLPYFSDMIQIETGEALNGHNQTHLINSAKQRLANKEEKVEEITRQLGFHDMRAFNRMFKLLTGCTPQEYRTSIN